MFKNSNKTVSRKYLSAVIPIYNEEGNIDELLGRVAKVLASLSSDSEIICVDDCSSDSSVEKLLQYKEKYPLRVIRLKKHRGKSWATAVGVKAAGGEFIAIMDADMESAPEEIPGFLKIILSGYDGVCSIREGRKADFITKASSWVGNTFRNFVTGEKIKDINAPLKLFRRRAIKSAPHFKGYHRFIPSLVKMGGYSLKFVPVKHCSRKAGCSNYNIRNRILKGLVDVFGVRWLKKNAIKIKDAAEEL